MPVICGIEILSLVIKQKINKRISFFVNQSASLFDVCFVFHDHTKVRGFAAQAVETMTKTLLKINPVLTSEHLKGCKNIKYVCT